MNIIIAGAGKVGFNLAKTLSIGHNVTIIDKNDEALFRIQESLDILPMRGDVEDSATYEAFSDKNIDLFIAVTNLDNVNLVSVIMAEAVLDIKRTFVRLQKEFFHGSDIQKRLGIDRLIFPIKLASKGIVSLLDYPKANNAKFFKYTDYKLISVMVAEEFAPGYIEESGFLLVGIEREKRFFIPESACEILPKDLLYLFGDEAAIASVCTTLRGEKKETIRRCVVFGGGTLGISIAKELVAWGGDVKLVEENLELCEKADEALQGKASIINSKYHSHDIFEEELQHADIFIAASNDDEFNIIKSLEAKESGIEKVVAINNEMEYYNLMHSLGIVVVRGPKISAYNTILEEINSTALVLQKSYCGAKAVVFMRKIFYTSGLVGKKIKAPKMADTRFFCLREEQFLFLEEKVVLEDGDLVVAYCSEKVSPKVKQWIYGL